MPDFVTLTCPSCGGRLQIAGQTDLFTCTHCGNEHLVRRRGGAVSLTPVEGLLRQTASELAIKRLQQEIQQLEPQLPPLRQEVDRLSAVAEPSPRLYRALLVWLALALLANFFVCVDMTLLESGAIGTCFALPALFSLFGFLPLGLVIRHRNRRQRYRQAQRDLVDPRSRLAEKEAALRQLRAELAEHRSIVRRQ